MDTTHFEFEARNSKTRTREKLASSGWQQWRQRRELGARASGVAMPTLRTEPRAGAERRGARENGARLSGTKALGC